MSINGIGKLIARSQINSHKVTKAQIKYIKFLSVFVTLWHN